MDQPKILKGFSKLSEKEKQQCVAGFFNNPSEVMDLYQSFHHPDHKIREKLSGISENTLTNYPLPYGVAPNFIINGKTYILPMVVEESSVVAAAAAAARFWAERGGFAARVLGTTKTGQLHFLYRGDKSWLQEQFPAIEIHLRNQLKPLLANMEKRGGGLKSLKLMNQSHLMDDYFLLQGGFLTGDAMGANFINTCMEAISEAMEEYLKQTDKSPSHYEPLMAILSNYNDECLVEASVSCETNQMDGVAPNMSGKDFARRMVMAVRIAQVDVFRATTHNKGIMNGVDALVLATGNDFRAIEAAAHAYAARSGHYTSLSSARVNENTFELSLTLPLALGTVGGLTRLHPLAAHSLEMLGNPSAEQLMMVAASAGLANHFSALRSLTTTGIQAGHMRMHLPNILRQLGASAEETKEISQQFDQQTVSHRVVASALAQLRKEKGDVSE